MQRSDVRDVVIDAVTLVIELVKPSPVAEGWLRRVPGRLPHVDRVPRFPEGVHVAASTWGG
jgi:hypothetical protein